MHLLESIETSNNKNIKYKSLGFNKGRGHFFFTVPHYVFEHTIFVGLNL